MPERVDYYKRLSFDVARRALRETLAAPVVGDGEAHTPQRIEMLHGLGGRMCLGLFRGVLLRQFVGGVSTVGSVDAQIVPRRECTRRRAEQPLEVITHVRVRARIAD